MAYITRYNDKLLPKLQLAYCQRYPKNKFQYNLNQNINPILNKIAKVFVKAAAIVFMAHYVYI